MKNVFKARIVPLFGLIILTAIIGFAVGCSSPEGPEKEPPEEPTFVAVTNITGIPANKLTGTDLTLNGTVQPSDATNKTIIWSISNAGTTGASLTGNVLKTTAEGTATVTATITNGATATTPYTKDFTITVANTPPAFIPVSDITGVPTSATVNANLTLTGSVEPSDATNKTIVWSIATANALSGATVTNGVFKATAAGTATVTATITNGASATTNYTKNFTITVTGGGQPEPFGITAAELVAGIKIGWNLGNTLDAAHLDWLGANPTVAQMETGWGNPVTTRANIDAIKNAGFNGIRIPVSWTKAAGGAPNYTIRSDWMARVTAVVDYAVANDMYILLNTHHDEDVFKFTNANKSASIAAFRKIWEQIADNFKDYNEKLIFEGLNEPRTKGSSAEWNGGTQEEWTAINEHYQAFVDVVRASGGYNDKRVLMVNPYAASGTEAAINGLVIPTDTVPNKIIVSYHAYEPYNFALNEGSGAVSTWNSTSLADTNPITERVDRAYTKFVSKGIPVIIGEFGATNTANGTEKNNEQTRASWAEFYVSYAKSKGIPCFWWDGGTDGFKLFNRADNTFHFPAILTGLMNGVGSTTPPIGGGDPTPNDITGNMGNYSFGVQENEADPNYQQAVWTLTGTNLTAAKAPNAKLVLVLSQAPSASMQLVWKGSVGEKWWQFTDILGDSGNVLSATNATWNSGTKTLTLNLASALADYSDFQLQNSVKLIIAYYNGGSVNELGIVSANLQ